MPLSRRSRSASSTVTGMPALAKFMAMPPPMVPAPMTAARRTGRVGVSSGTSAILEAARSAKKAWRSALDSVVPRRARKRSRSTRSPSSNGREAAAASASTHLSGAGYPFDTAATAPRATARNPSALGWRTGRSRSRGSGRRVAIVSAKAAAFSTRSPSTSASKSRVPASCAAGTVVPETIMLSAVSRPTARGRRWVPPAPGRSPSFTSGNATWAPAPATR